MALRVLHVEDDPDIRTITKIALDHAGGFELVQCEDGQAALDYAPGTSSDVLLFDLMIPNMSGDVLLAEIRKVPNYEDTPVIFMTAKGQAAELDALKDIGALDVIVKPFDPMSLGDQIKKIIGVVD